MFDWTKNIKRFWPAIILALALVLIVDGTISSLETCHPPNSASNGQNSDKDCTVLQGPLVSFIVAIGDFVGDHDKGIVAAFTAILAISTIGLWNTTIGLYSSGEKQIRSSRQIGAIQARQSRQQFKFAREIADRQAKDIQEQLKIARDGAEAAKKSADVAEAALTVAERPYLVPTEPKMKMWRYGPPGMPAVNPPEYVGSIQYGFFNMGRTVAFLKEVCVRLIFVEILPDSPSYQAAVESPNDTDPRVMAGHYPVGTEKPYDCPTYGIGLKQKIRADKFNDIQSGKLNAFFFGYVRYTDVFDYLHTEGFCFRYTQIGVDQTPSICAIVAGKNYNYSRREKVPPEGFATLPPQGAELTSEDVEKLNAQMRAERGKPV